jgi:hypothetical protein
MDSPALKALLNQLVYAKNHENSASRFFTTTSYPDIIHDVDDDYLDTGGNSLLYREPAYADYEDSRLLFPPPRVGDAPSSPAYVEDVLRRYPALLGQYDR